MKPTMFAALTLATGLAGASLHAQEKDRERNGGRAPQRIVTLSPSLTEAVCALGHCAQLVGTDRHSTGPGAVSALPKVGGLEDVQIERIVTLRPDMVLLGPRSRAAERLASLGVPVQMFDARTHADLKRMLLALGQSLGEEARAAELIRRIDGEIDAAARRMSAALRGRSVFVEVASGPYAASEGSFIGETIARLGLVNIVGGEMGLFPKVNSEMVVRRAPELIIGPRASLANLADRPGWAALPAVRRRQVCMFEAEQWELISSPGPRLGEAAGLLADCLLALGPR
ncbi:ABC transporter substrate-binding protein [Pelomonas sp. KK5]|uniref:ABC transporter substrate-binding protein n=1 Tax=Pelomonas sp. KK5 TaxID=1855730 RepID=UPI00097CA167|nr:helical backbone metal receptor [Pelomonas sp. KK5]